MQRATLIGGYLLRLTHEDGRTRIVLRDLKRNDTIEFETWVAAWAFIDGVLRDFDGGTPRSLDPDAVR